MADAAEGTIIKDLGNSLPQIEDFFYNDLDGYETEKLPENATTMWYQEDPPESRDFLGLSANGALLSIKLSKDAFNFSVKDTLANSYSGNSVRVNLSQAEYGGYAIIKSMIDQFKNNPDMAAYYAKMGAADESLYNRTGLNNAANLRLLYCNLPEVPHFTSTEVDQDQIIRKTYGSLKESAIVNLKQYHYCNIPYPYEIDYTYKKEYDEIEWSCPNFKNASKSLKTKYNDNDEISFVEENGTYYQVIELDRFHENRHELSSKVKRNVLILNNSDKTATAEAVRAYKAKDTLLEYIEKAKDIRLVLDVNTITNQSSATTYLSSYPLEYSNAGPVGNLTNYIKDIANHVLDDSWYKYAGYVPYGLDKYRRIGGVIFVQVEVNNEKTKKPELVWYNLNKLMIANANNQDSPMTSNSATDQYHLGGGPVALKGYTYDYANRLYVDRFWREAGENEENRRRVQRQIFQEEGINLFPTGSGTYATDDDVFYNWTVAIGDVTFFVPPENIRIVSQTETTRVPVMRAKGTIAKGRERSMQYLELNLFFNEERGINGAKYEEESPNKKYKFTYKMNGLRALLAEMKFTPFLPIINKYINEVLGIHAVCFENINIGTVPGFPKLLKAQLLLSKFNYQVYMPEIPQPDNNGAMSPDTRNPFSACIAYDTMRWYYQRCIILGDELDRLLNEDDKAKRITVNSFEFYMRTIFANRTALLPCHFVNPNIDLYVSDEDHLKKLLKIKQDALRKAQNVSDNYAPNENELRWIKECNKLSSNVDIATIYAKYVGRASEMLSALDRAKHNPNQLERLTSGNGKNDGNIEVLYDSGTYVIKYNGKEYTDDTIDNFLDAWLYEPMQQEFIQKFDSLRNEMEDPIISDVDIDRENSIIKIVMNTSGYLSKGERKNTTKESTRYYKSQGTVLTTDPDKIFDDSVIALQIIYTSTDLEDMKEGIYNLEDAETKSPLEKCLYKLQDYYQSSAVINPIVDKNSSLHFLKWCQLVGQGIIDANEEATELKDAIDYENIRSLKYIPLLNDVCVNQFSASVGNTYARIGITGIDGSAPQYMGGQDTHLSWTIETKDEEVASVFKSLPELTAYLTRTYRKVLPTYPIKIDSEFTRMLGVMEITVDNVAVTTVENFPGLYRIVVNATSVDRTLRNKESLKLLDIKNQGLEDSRKKTAVQLKSYKEINDKFQEAEIYPDLELPKIDELGELGWRYIRYRAKERQDGKFYIDPDFYFIYPYLTAGRALAEALRCTFEEKLRKGYSQEDISQFLIDNSGRKRVVRLDGSIDPKEMNDKANEDVQDYRAKKMSEIKEDRTYYLDPIKSALLRIPYGSIDVCEKIRCVFMEPYYLNETQWYKENNDKAAKEEAEKIADILKKFNNCAEEIEKYLTEKDDNLASSNESIDPRYNGDNIKKYFETSGFWNIIKKYGLFPGATWESMAEEDENVSLYEKVTKYTNTDGSFNSSAKSSEEEATLNDVVYLVQAVADAISSREECSAKNKSKNFFRHPWQADLNKPRAVNGTTVFDTKEAIKRSNAVSFGIFGIRRYNYAEMINFLPNEEKAELQKRYLKDKSAYYVLDPYFRYKSKEIRDQYLQNCANNPAYCLTAFCRIVTWYMAKLIRYRIIPSIEFDVKRNDSVTIVKANNSATKFLKNQGIKYDVANNFFANLKEFAKNNGQAFDTGKFFAAILLALTGEGFGKNTLFDMYNMRDYNNLNQLIKTVTSVKYKFHNENDPTYLNRNRLLRRYLLALYGYDIIPDPHNIASDVSASPTSKFLANYNTQIAAEACGNPVQYMRDSFYDMIRNDYRGRMLRAFPTFYMIFVDEGREIGLWKLHDNFYNFNAIHEIQIVKSRKIAADTCLITLSNMFQTFTTNDEDCLANYKASFGDLYESFLDPKSEAERLELRRLASKKINRAKLQPGIRIHVRLGYGANAADLPGIFNGVIAEIKNGEMVQIVAQGDGVELCNPIYMEETADIMRNTDNFATMDNIVCGAPPAQILQRLLTSKGGPMAAWIRGQYYSNILNYGPIPAPGFNKDGFIMYGLYNIFKNNPYGIRHFGDPDYRVIFKQGEPCQNIYHITNKNSNSVVFDSKDFSNKVYFGDDILDLDTSYKGSIGEGNDQLPYISFKPYGRTVWDMMHICKSIAPDYMVGIADFEFRSTVFMGKPHFYYAYKYARAGDGHSWYEKRKPYQQWHLYNNFSDIVENKISASSEKMKTNATGLYEVEGGGIKKTEPMWVDQDIYPEYQKSMVVDTKLYGKSWFKHNALVGGIMGFTNHIPLAGDFIDWLADGVAMVTNDLMDDWFATWFDNRGEVQSHSTQAEDAVIDALKNSVKEMYQGYMIVLGDPTIKPNDRIHIMDAYEDMNGLCDVREVVQTLNPYTGFTTTITPDCISAHELNAEINKMDVAGQMISRYAMGAIITVGGSFFGNTLSAIGAKTLQKFANPVFKNLDYALNHSNTFGLLRELVKIKKISPKGLWQWFAQYGAAGKIRFKLIFDKLGASLFRQTIVAGKAKFGMSVPAMIGTAIFSILTGSANTALYRTAKGSQTLYIFPLRKFGKALTAGVDGQQGLVYGTLQFNAPGPIEQLLGQWFAHSNSELWNVIKGIFIDEQVMREMDKFDFSEDADLREKIMGNREEELNESDLQAFSGVHMDKSMYRPSSAYGMSLMPRAMVQGVEKNLSKVDRTSENQETIRQAVRSRYYIDNINTWPVHPNIHNLEYIEDSLLLKTYFNSGFLCTLPQALIKSALKNQKELDLDNLIYYSVRMPKGNTKQIIGVKRLETNKKTGENIVTVDIPYTSAEGIRILYELCQDICFNSGFLANPDSKESNQKIKDTSIIISSADIIGSQNDLYGSGFHLILTGTGKLGEPGVLKKYVEQYHAKIQKQLQLDELKYIHLPLFTIDKMSKDNEVGISIGVPTPYSNNMAKKFDDKQTATNTPKDTDTMASQTPDLQDALWYQQHVSYSDLDEIGRCGSAYARITYKDMKLGTKDKREELSKIQTAGYKYIPYTENGQDKHLYEKCHLIAHSLIGEEANPKNLVTGTTEFNARMNEYEKRVQRYLTANKKNTVLYKVTPVYDGTNLIPSSVIMEAIDVTPESSKTITKDSQKEVPFKVTIYNTQRNWTINYNNGNAKQKK